MKNSSTSITPSSEVINVFVKLVEKSFRPEIDSAIGGHLGRNNLLAWEGSGLEKVQLDLFRRQTPCSHGPTQSIQDMVAVRLYDHLNACLGNLGKEPAHQCLTTRMQMDFRIFD